MEGSYSFFEASLKNQSDWAECEFPADSLLQHTGQIPLCLTPVNVMARMCKMPINNLVV